MFPFVVLPLLPSLISTTVLQTRRPATCGHSHRAPYSTPPLPLGSVRQQRPKALVVCLLDDCLLPFFVRDRQGANLIPLLNNGCTLIGVVVPLDYRSIVGTRVAALKTRTAPPQRSTQ